MISASLLLSILSDNGGLPKGFTIVNGSTINIALGTLNDKRFVLISGSLDSDHYYLQVDHDLMPLKLFRVLGKADAVIVCDRQYFNLYCYY